MTHGRQLPGCLEDARLNSRIRVSPRDDEPYEHGVGAVRDLAGASSRVARLPPEAIFPECGAQRKSSKRRDEEYGCQPTGAPAIPSDDGDDDRKREYGSRPDQHRQQRALGE
jgi:hypothetical protein